MKLIFYYKTKTKDKHNYFIKTLSPQKFSAGYLVTKKKTKSSLYFVIKAVINHVINRLVQSKKTDYILKNLRVIICCF